MAMHAKSQKPVPQRRGFTLVEMLVSVTLVLLMMTLFMAAFQLATDSVKTQQKIAENDQKVRALTGLIRGDIAKRTMRRVQPFFPGETTASPTSFGERAGYFYISTNNGNSSGDDVLQLTLDVNQTQQNTDLTNYFGHAEQLVDRTLVDGVSLTQSPNQPELDDGRLDINSTASSSAAEVSYFIRNGNLYRRVLLLREPLPISGQDLSAQPTNSADSDFFAGVDDMANYDGLYQITSGLSDDFWTHFDLAAYPTNVSGNLKATVLGLSSLNNDGVTVAIADPRYRFGFDTATGRSREHLAAGGLFMGRFLHAETSAPNFNYPQQHCQEESLAGRLLDNTATANGNPMDPTVEFTLNKYGVIERFDNVVGGGTNGRGGSRAVEDLLLANVHEMRIEVWDERLRAYASMAHSSLDASSVAGDYHVSRRLNGLVGPYSSPAVFDTWNAHNNIDLDGSGSVVDGERPAPFVAYSIYPPVFPAGPSPAGMPGPFPDDTNSSPGLSYWLPSKEFAVGDVTFASFADIDGDTQFEWFSDPAGVVSDGVSPQGFDLIFECIAIDDPDSNGLGFTDATEPTWPNTVGRIVRDGQVTWRVIDNRRPLRAIRMTLRFLHQRSGDMRQLTLELSLQDDN